MGCYSCQREKETGHTQENSNKALLLGKNAVIMLFSVKTLDFYQRIGYTI
jgi:hypothetical protein